MKVHKLWSDHSNLVVQFCCFSVTYSCLTLCRPQGLQQARHSCPLPSNGACSNSCSLSQWCHPIISSSVIPFPSYLQSSPASGSFPVSQFFPSGGQSIGVSASASVLPLNIPDWFPLELTGLFLAVQGTLKSLLHTTVRNFQFFSSQPSLWSNCHIHTWLLKNRSFD